MNKKLKARIIEVYWNQSRFAKCCGKSDDWLSRIITGRQTPTKEDKELICRKLKIQNPEEYIK